MIDRYVLSIGTRHMIDRRSSITTTSSKTQTPAIRPATILCNHALPCVQRLNVSTIAPSKYLLDPHFGWLGGREVLRMIMSIRYHLSSGSSCLKSVFKLSVPTSIASCHNFRVAAFAHSNFLKAQRYQTGFAESSQAQAIVRIF
jgi:hypothetical protein